MRVEFGNQQRTEPEPLSGRGSGAITGGSLPVFGGPTISGGAESTPRFGEKEEISANQHRERAPEERGDGRPRLINAAMVGGSAVRSWRTYDHPGARSLRFKIDEWKSFAETNITMAFRNTH